MTLVALDPPASAEEDRLFDGRITMRRHSPTPIASSDVK